MSSPNHSTSDIEDAFSSMNILNYTPVSSNYFPTSSESSSFNSSENSNIIPSVIPPFYDNPCLKDVQTFYAKESPISSPDPTTPPAILTPSPQIYPPSSSSTTLSNSSWNQTFNLVLPSFSVYTPTPPQIFEIGNSSVKMHLKHHEEQIEDILNYLDELSFHRIEKMEEGPTNYDVPMCCLSALEARSTVSQNRIQGSSALSGLPRSIEGNVTASKPQTLEEATNIAQRLMDQIIKHDSMQETNDHKRKLEEKRNIINNNNYQNNYKNNNRNNDYHQQQNRRQETFRTYAATNGYTGNHPLCERCTLHHIGPCTVKCQTCNRVERKDIMQIGAQKQTTGPQEGVLRDKFTFVHSRISTLETTLEDIQVHHQNLLKHTS
ncbi:hypothetical protein Tco_0575636 [Tanacetum coccineum]